MRKELGLFILLMVLCLAVIGIDIGGQLHNGASLMHLERPRFLGEFNLANQAYIIGMYGIFSIGLGLVIITGGIDLSVGSMLALVGMLLIIALTDWHWAWPVAALFALAVSVVLGWTHGFLITRFRLQPFVVTLCGLLMYRGIARFIADDATKGIGNAKGFEGFRDFCKGNFIGLPIPFIIMLVIAVIAWFVLHRSVYGRYLYAVGRNEEAARFSGINTRRVIVWSYVIAGLLTGIASILFAFFTESVVPSTHGNFYELYGIAAAVVGGCSLRGGEGSILGILIGTALLQVLQNLVNLLGIPSSLNFAVMGAVVLIGVLVDTIVQNRVKKKLARAPK